MKCYPMLAVADVAASSRWYRELLGLTSGHGGDEFEMLMDGSNVALLLHLRDAHEHPELVIPEGAVAGAGVLIYFSVSDVTAVFEQARALAADLIDEPHENPRARAIEFSLRDPDGYALSVSQWKG